MDVVTAFLLGKKYTDEKISLRRRFKVLKPDGFTWDAPINIYTDGNGNFETDFDVSDYQITGKTYYADINKGKSTNDGLTADTPLDTIRNAIDKGADVVLVGGGVYPRNQFTKINKNISIKALPGHEVKCPTIDILSYVKPSTYTNVYRATRTGVYNVVDSLYQDRFGNPTEYTLLTTIDEVDSTPGSWYREGSYIYIHAMDSQRVDNTIWALLSVRNLHITDDITVYAEGIDFIGGLDCVRIEGSATSKPNFYAKRCSFSSDFRGNGVSIFGGEYAFFQLCQANDNVDDGFNYQRLEDTAPKVIEVDCVGINNGTGGGSTHNGSSAHGGTKIVRLNGFYGYNRGPNLPDVNTNTESWNLGVTGACSVTTNDDQNADFTGDGLSKMWLDSCISYGSKLSIDARAGSNIKTRNMRYDGEVNATGIIERY